MDAYEKQVAEIMTRRNSNIEAVNKAWEARFENDFNDAMKFIMNKRNEVRDVVMEQLRTTGAKVETIPRHDLEEVVDRVIGLTLTKMEVEQQMRG